MRDYWIILKQQIRQRLGLSLIKQNLRGGKSGAKAVSIALAVLIGIVSIEGIIITGEFYLARALSRASMSYITLFLGMLITMIATLITGAAFLMSVLYFSRDSEALAVLPVNTRSVFMAKMTVAYIGELGVSAAIVWPLLILVGIFDKMGASYFIKAFIVWFAAISLPLTLSALVSLPLMRFTALWKRREVFAVIGGILLMVVIILGQSYFSTRMVAVLEENPEQIVLLLFGRTKLFETIANTIPPLRLALGALTQTGLSGIYNLLGLLAVSAALIFITLILAQKLYRGGAAAQLETFRSGKELAWHDVRLAERSPVKAVFQREVKVLLRTPVYALNSLATLIVLPLMLLMPMMMSSIMQDADMQALMRMLEGITDKYAIALIMAGIVSLFAGLNVAVSTSISREGRQFFWIKVLPVSYMDHLKGKLLVGVALSFVTVIIAVVFSIIGLKLPMDIVFLGAIPGVIMCVPMCALQLTVDAIKPKLAWSNPTEAIKQNMNSIIGMLIVALLVAALGFGGFLLLKVGTAPRLLYLITIALTLVITAVSLWWMNKAATRSMCVIEV